MLRQRETWAQKRLDGGGAEADDHLRMEGCAFDEPLLLAVGGMAD
jgi:hypothetical protein